MGSTPKGGKQICAMNSSVLFCIIPTGMYVTYLNVTYLADVTYLLIHPPRRMAEATSKETDSIP